jgi:hypothetical protein
MRVSFAHILSLAAVAALASTATMQAAEQGKFHLSTPAYWGQAKLPPGDYKIEMPAPSLGHSGFVIEGDNKTVFEYPLVTNTTGNYTASNFLKLSEFGGNYYIREFASGATGKTFTFAIPKAIRRQEMANGKDSGFALAVH